MHGVTEHFTALANTVLSFVANTGLHRRTGCFAFKFCQHSVQDPYSVLWRSVASKLCLADLARLPVLPSAAYVARGF